jgi:hypothetical protein
VRIALVGTAAFAVVALAAWASPAAGAAAGACCLLALALWRPALLVALAFNGFFVYLAVVDLAGQARETTWYYAALGGALAIAAWRGRRRLVDRIAHGDRIVRLWAGAALALGSWFVLNGALYRAGGHEATVLLGEFAGVTAPAVVVLFTLPRRAIRELLVGIVLLGIAFVAADVIALVHGTTLVDDRFTPLASVDPITAGLVPAFAAAALLGLDFSTDRRHIVLGGMLALLVAGAVVPGSRGPVVMLCAVLVVAVALRRRERLRIVGAASVAGALLALGGGSLTGSSAHLTRGLGDGIPRRSPRSASPAHPPSTIRMRWYWLTSAVRAVPDRPLFGHGLAALPDESPEAYAMGVGGKRIYPHNDVVEALYSLGVIGLLLFVAALLAPVLLAGASGMSYAATLLFTAAFAESNFSGEIGADVGLWLGATLLVLARTCTGTPDDRR